MELRVEQRLSVWEGALNSICTPKEEKEERREGSYGLVDRVLAWHTEF